MNINNPLYKNQGIHVSCALFTVIKKEIKVLLLKRSNEPYNGYWMLPGGAVYNNEDCETAMQRELFEKTGMKNIYVEQFHAFSNPDRSPLMRMIAIGYIGIISADDVQIKKVTEKTQDYKWFCLDEIPDDMAYDHRDILGCAIEEMRNRITRTTIAKTLLPEKFSIPEMQSVYSALLEQEFDRRNFRKKMISSGLIEEVGIDENAYGHRPAKLYRFKDND